MIYEKLALSDIVLLQATYYFKVHKSTLFLVSCSNLHLEGDNYLSKVIYDKKVEMCIDQELFKDIRTTNFEMITQ